MRILAIDPGEKNIGLALSDPTGTIANPLKVLEHKARAKDAKAIVRLAEQYNVERIIVGQNLDVDGSPTYQGRKARRLAAAIRARTDIRIEFWDEYGSTQTARDARIAMGVSRRKRSGHLDALAATVILQSYLNANQALCKENL
ncbi:MAG: Holliday junction resolvase RuvX [Chloroflexota bacterium]|nr:Holliday junction resolvase RuvX [Chloroflexota bacterium]